MFRLAQVLSALVGWSSIKECPTNGGSQCKKQSDHGTKKECKYLEEIEPTNKCATCGCIKGGSTEHLARGCQRCKDSGSDCQCKGGTCTGPDSCKCAKEGKCCKCCCKGQCGNCKKECSCIKEEDKSYKSAYSRGLKATYVEVSIENRPPLWSDLSTAYRWDTNNLTPSQRRHHSARILLGSVCLIWSGLTYMYWTGRYAESSPYWNNHILDVSGLDDGTLSQWLQALGFPRDMLNNKGPENRLDKVVTDEFRDMLYLGFPDSSNSNVHGQDNNANTFRSPANLTYGGFIHKINKGAFDKDGPFMGDTERKIDQNKLGPLLKLYIVSCAYFTGLQRKNTESATQSTTPRTPRTIREILYWLSALPYSPAYPKVLAHGKHRLTEVTKDNQNKYLSFQQTGRTASINVQDVDLYSHFQAVTQYCPLVLIGIQGGLGKSTDNTKEPAIHSLYANTECHFTYPTVSIQAYNQVVHYIRALFYQLYFLRKQCAVKVTCGGTWRECRYGKDVVSKGVISWMCLGCSPMEHDRKWRVDKVKGELDGVMKKVKKEWKGEESEEENGVNSKEVVKALKELLEKIGEVVVQLGNAQERLDRGKYDLDGVRQALDKVVSLVNWKDKFINVLKEVLDELVKLVEALEKVVEEKEKALEGAQEALKKGLSQLNRQKLYDSKTEVDKAKTKIGEAKNALTAAKNAFPGNSSHVDPCKNIVSATIDGLHKVLEALKEGVKHIIEATKKDTTEFQNAILYASDTAEVITKLQEPRDNQQATLEALSALLQAIDKLIPICTTPKCTGCTKHSDKCGQEGNPIMCTKCGNMTTTGVPSPLQAFLEDRLPGFSCNNVPTDEDPEYPPAADHLGHCNGSGQCCPLPMGFRGQFQGGSTSDMTGSRLYGILYFFSNGDMMQSCVYTLVRVTAALSATTPQVLGDVFGFFRGGIGEKDNGWTKAGLDTAIGETKWIAVSDTTADTYKTTLGEALVNIKGQTDSHGATQQPTKKCHCDLSSLSDCTHDGCAKFISPLTGELYTAVSATFGGTYLSWVLYLSDALQWGLKSLAREFKQIECRGCKGCDPNKCRKGEHGTKSDKGSTGLCQCQSIVSCTGVLPVLYRHGLGMVTSVSCLIMEVTSSTLLVR